MSQFERLLVVLALAGCVCLGIGLEKMTHRCPATPVRAEDFRP